MSVYLDAVFYPKLEELDFKQEGHRLEFLEDGSLCVKGIVYNEMKGAMVSYPMLYLLTAIRLKVLPCLLPNSTKNYSPPLLMGTILVVILKRFGI